MGRGGGWRRHGRRAEGRTTPEERARLRAWVAGRAPAEWRVDAAGVRVDDDEILVVAQLDDVEVAEGGAGEREAAEAGRISGFREETRARRMQIAEEASEGFGRVVSWGATCGGTTLLFTTASVPVMTRLRIEERLVLDTLVDAGVARSRSDALAWCVRLVGRHEEGWISDLRAAFEHVEAVRSRGPTSEQD
ncbi:MAG: hypothetical protein ACRDWE_05065 [Acidimicrobiales bacterium]